MDIPSAGTLHLGRAVGGQWALSLPWRDAGPRHWRTYSRSVGVRSAVPINGPTLSCYPMYLTNGRPVSPFEAIPRGSTHPQLRRRFLTWPEGCPSLQPQWGTPSTKAISFLRMWRDLILGSLCRMRHLSLLLSLLLVLWWGVQVAANSLVE